MKLTGYFQESLVPQSTASEVLSPSASLSFGTEETPSTTGAGVNNRGLTPGDTAAVQSVKQFRQEAEKAEATADKLAQENRLLKKQLDAVS